MSSEWILVAVLTCVPVCLIFLSWSGILAPFWSERDVALSKIPGPRLASLTRFWILSRVYNYGFSEECVNLAKTYGSVVRIGPNNVLLSNPADVRKVLAVGSSYTRGPWFDALKLHHDETNIVCERDPKRHQQKRNILGPGLSGKNLQSLESIVDNHVRELIMQWRASKSNAAIDIMTTFRFFAVDVLSQLALGEPFGDLKESKDVHDFIYIFNAGTRVQTCLSIFPEVKNILVILSHIPILGGYLAPSPGDGSALGNVLTIIENAVKARFSQRSPKVEMLDLFMARGLAEKDAMEELLIIMSAGIETTTTAIKAILYLILNHPEVTAKLQKEISETISSDPEFPAKESTIRNMTYLQACIAEGLRMYPPSFQLRERMAPKSGDIVGDYFLPGGTFIGINSKAAQLTNTFGDDVESFNPERWLIEDAEKVAQMSRNLELVFNYGSTKCLGMNIACMELNKVVLELFRNFDVKLAPICKLHGVEVIPRKLLLNLKAKSSTQT